MIDYIRPANLQQALDARTRYPDYMLLSGGTDLLVGAHRHDSPVGIIDLFGLQALIGVKSGKNGTLTIGAATTYTDIIASDLARRELPALVAAARDIGALQIQARGTIGGNIGTSSPVGDTLPVLLALDAFIEVASVDSRRLLPYSAFCTGYRRIDLAANELIVAVHIPPITLGTRQFWRKVGPRKAQSISKVMAAAALRVEDGHIAEARIGLGAVADRPIRASAVENSILGKKLELSTAEAACAALTADIAPIDDVRSTARYRLRVAQNLITHFISQL